MTGKGDILSDCDSLNFFPFGFVTGKGDILSDCDTISILVRYINVKSLLSLRMPFDILVVGGMQEF